MQYFKLQIGCLAVVLFTTILYIRKSMDKNIPCHKLYDAILILSPWAIFFDGLTSWTVNHMDIVPPTINLIAHACFFVAEDLMIIITFFYMLDTTVGLKHCKRLIPILAIPGFVSLIVILANLGQLYYVQGNITNYSMGISVYACYGSLAFHMLLIFIMVLAHYRSIEKIKRIGVMLSIGVSIAILMVQTILPESLISALFPTFLVLGFYLSLEDPSVRKLRHYNQTMVSDFATLVENRDDSTGGHIKRTRLYVEIIIQEMNHIPKYRHLLTEDYMRNIINAAPMHDIGKISTPDVILQKPGKLTDEEFDIMKQHAPKGGEIIRETFADLNDPEFEKIAYEVARYHHEKWNGRGYPEGLSGEDIPLHARIMAIADVFDAVSAKRCYRDAMPLDKCFQIIEEGIDRDFDPSLARIFLNARDKVTAIYEEHK